jgi:hypothetical protein
MLADSKLASQNEKKWPENDKSGETKLARTHTHTPKRKRKGDSVRLQRNLMGKHDKKKRRPEREMLPL